jgi:fructose-bisphosphate aldolase class I
MMLFPFKTLLMVVATLALSVRSESSSTTLSRDAAMMERIAHGEGFLAALDQSGGSTPKALGLYGFPKDQYAEGEASMFGAVHNMRTRIVTNPSFHGGKILGAILFEDTMQRHIPIGASSSSCSSIPTPEYLWTEKKIVPFLKIDKGLEAEENGVQLMKPIPKLGSTLALAKSSGIFGTKMRSVIKQNNPDGIQAVVEQQFDISRQILDAGLVPIIEPEVDIHSPDKQECEQRLKACLLEHLSKLRETDRVILKVSLPSVENFYQEIVEHPKCLRVVALSGGYTREAALELLWKQSGMIASFSRALTEGLRHDMSDNDFEKLLEESVSLIFAASKQ